jgi:hypothetical protein
MDDRKVVDGCRVTAAMVRAGLRVFDESGVVERPTWSEVLLVRRILEAALSVRATGTKSSAKKRTVQKS